MTNIPHQAKAFVVAQFILIVLVLTACGRVPKISAPGSWFLIAGLLLGAWALVVNRPENININPMPRDGGQLCVAGPYQFIRHPMYLAMLVTLGGFLLLNFCPIGLLAWLGLALVLERKANLEESLLVQHHAGYEGYCQRTKYRFIPWIY